MRRIPIVLLLMFGMVVGGSQAVPAASDHFIVLDPYDPRGINNRGEIVGGYTDAHGLHGFVRSQGTVTLFDGPVGACVPFPNAPETLAYSINNQSQIVGNYVTFVCDPQGSHTVDHGFLWVKGTLTTIDVPHSTNTDLYGINDHGEMVGSYTDASGTPHGFLLSKGTFTDIVVPHSPDVPIPFGINNQGDIVGNLGLHGFLLSKGRFTLIDPPGSVQTDARKISDQGEIVGFYMDANFLFHGYLFSPGRDETDARGDNEQGAFTEITVPGGANVEVFGINDRHEVVGDYADASNPSEALHSFEMQVGTETEAP